MRPVGKRVIQVCEIAERIGPAGYAEFSKHMEVNKPQYSSAFLRRAVKYGLMTVEVPDGGGRKGDCSIYQVNPRWREKIKKQQKQPIVKVAKEKPEKAKPVPPPKPVKDQRPRKLTAFSYVNSIFGMGA